jgi:RNA polymerase sigma-70 factor (ECF subfamily)
LPKNCYYSQIKKQKDILPLNEDSALSEEGLEEKLIKADEAERIRNALHKINEPYREVFMWRVFAEMSFKQIGSIFSKNENWACVTYHRARKMILDKLEENDNEK